MLSTGLDVVDIGVNHTPLLYFATAHWKLDGGATITGSHNPVSDNGVKMVHAGAAPLTESEIQGLLATIQAGDFERGVGTRATRGIRATSTGTRSPRRVTPRRRRLKVVVDAGNGIAGVFAPELLRRLGCEVVELYCESDGTFPNHLPDPEMEENVRDLVARSSRSAPTWAWPTTATPTGSASWTRRAGATRRTCCWPSSPAIS